MNQVFGLIKKNTISPGNNHHPFIFITKNFRISKIFSLLCKNRILLIFFPASSFIIAKSQALALLFCSPLTVSKKSSQPVIFFIYNSTSRPNLSMFIRCNGICKSLPMNEISTHRMSPVDFLLYVILMKQVIFSFIIHQPIRIINNIFFCRKVKFRSIFFHMYTIRHSSYECLSFSFHLHSAYSSLFLFYYDFFNSFKSAFK